jgi:predicted CoA-substrate-specific enzyme activase
MLACGVDVGSVQTKAVIVDGNRVVQGRGLAHSGANLARSARHAFQAALREAGREEWDITYVMGTGYGRFSIPFGHARAAETICQARGSIFRYPGTRTVLDIGGQDMTAIRVDAQGNVLDFCMNDKCAAGTGRFLESTADLLGLSIHEMGELGLKGTESLLITNVCSVMAEQEIVDYLEQGKSVEDVLAGVFEALARRAAGLISRVGLREEITLTGGVSQNRGMVKALEERLGYPINSGVDGVYIGALGGALLGLDRIEPLG